MKDKPSQMMGGLFVDDRGTVSFVNEFDFSGVKRFYMVNNYHRGFIRAWHAHRHEGKYVYVVRGSALVGAVEIDNWEMPSKSLKPHRIVLSEKTPSIYYIPKGYANGFMSLTDNLKIIFFSTAAIDESKDDDIRFDVRYWDIWNIEER